MSDIQDDFFTIYCNSEASGEISPMLKRMRTIADKYVFETMPLPHDFTKEAISSSLEIRDVELRNRIRIPISEVDILKKDIDNLKNQIKNEIKDEKEKKIFRFNTEDLDI